MRRRLVVLVVLVALAACARSEARPSGVTERWLQAVSEQGREGLREEGAERAAELAEPTATDKMKPAEPEEDKRFFSDLEVGKADVDGDQARVPFRVTVRVRGGAREERSAAAVLVSRDGEWRVTDVVPRVEGEAVPSEGGDRPARAAVGHWLLFLGLGLAMTAGSIFLIERQPTSTANAGSR